MKALISGQLDLMARQHPERPAVAEVGVKIENTLTWRDLDRITAELADQYLRSIEFDEKSLIIVEASNRLESAAAILAILRAGIGCAPINARSPQPERHRLFTAVARRFAKVYELNPQTGALDSACFASEDRPKASEPSPEYLLAGGGTSGVPRLIDGYIDGGALGPMGGYRLLLEGAGWTQGMRQLIVGPLYHSAPFRTFLSGVFAGHTIVLQGTFSAEITWNVLQREGIQWVQVTPTHMRRMMEGGAPPKSAVSALRGLLHTAAPCDIRTKRFWLDYLGPDRLFEAYGATEQIGMTLCNGHEWLERPGTVGRGFLTQVQVLGENGTPVPHGEPGTVYMRTAAGKGMRPAHHEAVQYSRSGFQTVGDQGRLDRDGYLYLDGRRTDVFSVGGANVYPDEIEAAILRVGGVVDVAVFAAEDPAFGAIPHAMIVIEGGSSIRAQEIREFCRRELSIHKVPKKIEIVDAIPRNEAGKIERSKLSLSSKIPEKGQPK
ncbi:AMP-binding protein [Nocardia vinacea]|uniref:AMP-binding protein n=1 Tax=Nocardia vinacea TaxID=96468 RepID=UPI0033CEB377